MKKTICIIEIFACLFLCSSYLLAQNRPDHEELYSIESGGALGALNLSDSVVVGDQNGDGLSDLLVQATMDGTSKIHFLSGIDGTLIRSYNGTFGTTVGDITGDGIPDSVSGATVRSGSDGSVLLELENSSSSGGSTAAAGDVNGDGIGDIIRDSLASSSIHSGADGSLITQLTYPAEPRHVRGPITSVIGVGDVDADGVPDFAAARPNPSGSQAWDGLVYVLSGQTSATIHRIAVRRGNVFCCTDMFGSSLTRVSDLDGDGVDDILVGSQSDVPSQLPHTLHPVSARTGYSISHNVRAGSLQHYGGFDFGIDVANVGDVNGDGKDDILAAESNMYGHYSSNGGEAIISLFTGNEIREFLGSSELGPSGANTVGGAGDVNGDGFNDFFVGNSVFVSTVPESPDVPSHHEAYGIENGGELGTLNLSDAVAISDQNGDGLSDLLINASVDGTDTVHLLSGINGTLIRSYDGNFGTTIGDISGDGIPDSVSGSTVRYGSNGAVIFRLGDSRPNGATSAAAGDVNGDGVGDIIRGTLAPSIYSGADGSLLTQLTFPSEPAIVNGDISSVIGVGDVDADGVPDFAAGRPYPAPHWDGLVYVLSGRTGDPIHRVAVRQGSAIFSATDGFGASLTSVSDLDGDGVDDILVGAVPSEIDPSRDTLIPISGRTGERITALRRDDLGGGLIYSSLSSNDLGVDIANVGDISGDGTDDILAAESNFFANDSVAIVRLFSGNEFRQIEIFGGSELGHSGANSVGAAGDVNGDGFSDFIVGNSMFMSSVAGATILGDVNMDGMVDFSDIPPFIELLMSQTFQTEADIDLNGAVDFLDITPFIVLLTGA